MAQAKTPHNFLLHLRNYRPDLARLTDGFRGLSFIGGTLEVKIDRSSWPGREIAGRDAEFREEAVAFFGGGTALDILPAKPDPERLPLPIEASKHWNHVAFAGFRPDGGGALLALRKTLYAAKMVQDGAEGEDRAETLALSWTPAGGDDRAEAFAAALPRLLDELCAFARAKMSYAQFLLPFPGHSAADRIEARLYAVRDWGTPSTPPAVLQKYTGRIHYCDPLAAPAGIKMSLAACGE